MSTTLPRIQGRKPSYIPKEQQQRNVQRVSLGSKSRRYRPSVEDPEYSRANPANLNRMRNFLAQDSNRVGGPLQDTSQIQDLLKVMSDTIGEKDVRAQRSARKEEILKRSESAREELVGSPNFYPKSTEGIVAQARLMAQISSSSDGSSSDDSEKFDNYLGDRAKFGDGDGSFWDRWVGTVGLAAGKDYLPPALPTVGSVAGGDILPRHGRKARLARRTGRLPGSRADGARAAAGGAGAGAGAGDGATALLRGTAGVTRRLAQRAARGEVRGAATVGRVVPYAERRAQTCARRERAKQRAERAALDTSSSSSADEGRQRRRRWRAEAPMQYSMPRDGQAASAPLLFEGPLDPRNYFGAAARRDFFAHFRQLERQRGRVADLGELAVAPVRPGLAPLFSLRDLEAGDPLATPRSAGDTSVESLTDNMKVVTSRLRPGTEDPGGSGGGGAGKAAAGEEGPGPLPTTADPSARRGSAASRPPLQGGATDGASRTPLASSRRPSRMPAVHPVYGLLDEEEEGGGKAPPPVRNPLVAALLARDDDSLDSQTLGQADGTYDAMPEGPGAAAVGAYPLGTPRTRLLVGAMRRGLPPRANLVLRAGHTAELRLAHQGLGDALGRLLADALAELPLVRAVDLTDNRLTDAALAPLLRSIASRKDVLHLNLSQNDIDEEGSHALRAFLKDSSCTLVDLRVEKADIDDTECVRLMEALVVNQTLTELDLANNLIGAQEERSIVEKDFVTGAEALGQTLCMTTCRIAKLDLSSNYIRLKSAVALGECLLTNTSITDLNLAYNSFGKEGGAAIGRALFDNKSLRSLNLANNSLDPRAAFIIAVALRYNSTIEEITLDGNPVGKVGGYSLMSLPATLERPLKLGLQGCTLSLPGGPRCWYNPEDPAERARGAGGLLALDLADEYNYAVLYEILWAMVKEPGLKISSITYEDPLSSDSGLDLEIVKQEIHPNQTLEYDVSEERLDELFDHFDADDSGQISLEEFDAGLNALGLGDKLTIDELRRIVAYADDSMDGYIDRSEFSAVIQYIYKEVNQGCKVTASLMNGGKAWNAPHKGLVKMKMDVQHMYNSKYECLTQQQLTNIFSTVEGNAQAGDLLQFAMENTRLKTAEAHALYAALQRETGAPEKAMAAVLARAAAPRYARVLLDAVFPRNSVERKRLRQLLGPTLLPLIGLHVGHYSLDLSEKADRETFKQVVEMNHYEAEISKKVCRFDTSQTRDWKNFRNVRLNGEAFKLKKAFMACPPPSGTLAFDYVETTRPGQCTFLSLPHGRTEDHRFLRLLQEAGVIAEEEAMEAGEAASLGALVAARGAPRYARTRSTYMEICKMYGDVLPNPKDHPKSDYTRPNLLPQRSGDGDGLLTPVAVQSHSPATGRQSSLSRKGSGAAGGDGEPNAAARPRSRVGSMGGSRRRGRAASRSGAGAGGARVFRGRALKTRRLVRRAATLSEEDVLFETKYLLAGRYFSAEQIQYLLTVFPARGRAALADVAVAAFPRVADLWRFGEVMEVLPPKVQAELVARLGILNVWSPLNPDGYLEVDFSRPEERQLGRALFHLCSLEPGAGLQGLSFQWSRLDPVIPGWKLLEMHQTEDGFPAKGVLSTWYVSGDWASSGGDGGSGDSRAPLQRAPLANAAAGLGGRGARPHANLRRALARCVVLGGTPSIDANDEPASPHPPGEPDELVNEVIRREGFMLRYDGQYRRQNSSMEQDGEEQEEK